MGVAVIMAVRMGMVMPMSILAAMMIVPVVVVMGVVRHRLAADEHLHMGGADGMALDPSCHQLPGLLGLHLAQTLADDLGRTAQIKQGGQEHVSGNSADGVEVQMAHGDFTSERVEMPRVGRIGYARRLPSTCPHRPHPMADLQPQPAVIQVAPACCCQTNKPGTLGKIVKRLLIGVAVLSILVNLYLFAIIAVVVGGGPEKSLASGLPVNYRNPRRVAVVEIKGTIDDAQAAYLSKALGHLDENPADAVVLRIDSPGGGVSAADQMHHAIEKFRADHKDIKVIASFGGVAASGGYYIAMPCDSIVCEKTGITGSIGVIAQVPALGGLAKKFGVEMNTVIADGSPHKADANDLFVSWYNDKGDLTPAGKAAKGVLGTLLNSAYTRFYDVVKVGRLKAGATEEEIKAFANGKVYTADEALKLKVVDAVGYLDDAIERARAAAKLPSDAPVSLIRHEKGGLAARILGSAPHAEGGVDLTNIQPGQMRDLVEGMGGVKLEYKMEMPVR